MLDKDKLKEILENQNIPIDNEKIQKKLKNAELLMSIQSSQRTFLYLCYNNFKVIISEDIPGLACAGFSRKIINKNASIEMSEYSNNFIYINSYFAQSDYVSAKLLMEVICHEILHIVLKTHERQFNRIPELWNIATDHCINRDLELYQLSNSLIFYEEFHKDHPNGSAEEVYNWLIKNKVTFTKVSFKGNGHGKGGGIIINDKGQTGNISAPEGMENKETVDDFIENAKNNYEITKKLSDLDGSKDRGLTPAGLLRELEKMFEYRLPWHEILRMAIKKYVLVPTDERCWRTPNKLHMARGIFLPGTPWEEQEDAVGTLIVSIDTSGSIGTKELGVFAGILAQFTQEFKTIILKVHDYTICQTEVFQGANKDKIIDFVKNTGFKGGGGTSHKEVFNYIEECWKDYNQRDEMSLYISLTDGYSDINELAESGTYEWCRNKFPGIFCIIDNPKFKTHLENLMTIHIDPKDVRDN